MTRTGSPQRHRLVVVGAGIVGIASALRLQRAGWDCLLVDPSLGDRDSASFGNAGHIATEQVAPLASWETIAGLPRRLFLFGGAVDLRAPRTVLPWAWRYLRAARAARFAHGVAAMRGLLAEALPAWRRLLEDIDAATQLESEGHTVLWESEAGAARGRAYWRGTELGTVRVHDLADAALAEYRQQLAAPVVAGLRFEGTGQLADVGGTIDAMLAAFCARGGRVMRARVSALRVARRRASVVLDSGHVLDGERVLVAAGIGSASLMASVGVRAPLVAERGYHLHWREHDWPAALTPTVFEDRSVILTRFRDGLRLAGFVEFARPDTPPDARKWAALQAHARALDLPVAGEARTWFGARPTLPDYLPAIGRARTADNLLYAFGHQHLGVTLAAVTAERVAALAGDDDREAGDPGSIDIEPLDVGPFDLGPFDHNPFDIARFDSAMTRRGHGAKTSARTSA